MVGDFAEKLRFALKVMNLSRAGLARALAMEKSAIGRWANGETRPSAHNLARLTELVARTAPGFTALDWDRDIAGLAQVLGVRAQVIAGDVAPAGLRLPLLRASLDVTARRGAAYEGFYRTTRPYAQAPGRYVHDQVMMWRDGDGLMHFDMDAGGVMLEGWALMLQAQLFIVASEMGSGAMGFAVLNGSHNLKVGVMDGLILYCATDPAHTPVATPMVVERTGDLSGDGDADRARFDALRRSDPLAPADSVPEDIRRRLSPDVGPAAAILGGDWVLHASLARSLAGGVPGWRGGAPAGA